jgi:hypothetical protein
MNSMGWNRRERTVASTPVADVARATVAQSRTQP